MIVELAARRRSASHPLSNDLDSPSPILPALRRGITSAAFVLCLVPGLGTLLCILAIIANWDGPIKLQLALFGLSFLSMISLLVLCIIFVPMH
jgi:hypothetical protein